MYTPTVNKIDLLSDRLGSLWLPEEDPDVSTCETDSTRSVGTQKPDVDTVTMGSRGQRRQRSRHNDGFDVSYCRKTTRKKCGKSCKV